MFKVVKISEKKTLWNCSSSYIWFPVFEDSKCEHMPTVRTTAMFSVVSLIIVQFGHLSMYTIIVCNSQNHTMNVFGHLDGNNSFR